MRTHRAAAGAKAPPVVHEVLRSRGRPLEPAVREFFEPRFQHDFSRVRIHEDPTAIESARAVHAAAYTVGQDIVFGGSVPARTDRGRRLLAHELAHVVQQSSATAVPGARLEISSPGGLLEREAEHASDAVAHGATPIMATRLALPATVLAREPAEVQEATEEERREVVEEAARFLRAVADQVDTLRRLARVARATTPASAAGPRAFHQHLNQQALERMLDKAISVFEAQKSDNPLVNFPAESPEQTRLGEAYALAMEQFGLALEEARLNAEQLAPTVRRAEEARYARNHTRWLEANPAMPLAAGIRTTFTQTEQALSARRHQRVSTQLADITANLHQYDLAGDGAERLRLALTNATYRLVRDPASGQVQAQPDPALQATIQPVLDQLSAIEWALGQAIDRLQRTETRTRDFVTDAAANTAVGDKLQAHFSTRDPRYATLLADRLARMSRELRGEGALTVHARDPQDPQCGAGTVGSGFSVTAAHAEANRFHFCQTVTLGDDEIVSTVIHETVHAVIPALGASGAVSSSADTPRDRAYAYERIYSRLSTEEALDNAESYSFYVDDLLGVAVARPSAPTDVVTGCADADPVHDAIARATYRIRLGAMWADQTLGGHGRGALPQWVVDIVQNGFPGADAARSRDVLLHMRQLASSLEYYLPVVCRPATDAEARAGTLAYGPSHRAIAGAVSATSRAYPAGTLRLCPAWFQADPAVREDALTAILVMRYRDTVPAADVTGIVALARHIQEEAHPSVAARTLEQHRAADAPPTPTP